MYDSTNVPAIPRSALLVLTYIDGDYVTDPQVARELPTARRVPTTTQAAGSLNAQIYDCERGDGDANQSVAWAGRKLAIREKPTIYCSRVGSPGYGWPDVLRALDNAHILHTAVDFGIADYYSGYQPHLVPGSAFTQFANPPGSGGDYDVSLTNGVWPNVPDPSTMLAQPACGIVATPDGGGYYEVAQDGGVFAYGDAPFFGSLPGNHIVPNKPVVGMTLYVISGVVKGYWLAGADGGVFSFGLAPFHGSANS